MIHADGARFEIDGGGGKASEREAWARGGVCAGAARAKRPRVMRRRWRFRFDVRVRLGSTEFGDEF